MAASKLHIQSFDGVEDLLRFVCNTRPVWRNTELASRKTGEADWNGTKTWQEAVNLAEYGWPEGRKKLSREVDLAAITHTKKPLEQFQYDVGGYRPIVPLAIAGDPMNMVSPDPLLHTPKPIVQIYVNITSSAYVTGAKRMYWGSALTSWVDQLETHRYPVGITIFEHTSPSGSYYGHGANTPNVAILCPIKSPGQALDIDRIAFWLINPANLRRHFFAVLERIDVQVGYQDGYGQPEHSLPKQLKDEAEQSGDVVLPLMVKDGAGSLESGLKMIGEQIKKHLDKLEDGRGR